MDVREVRLKRVITRKTPLLWWKNSVEVPALCRNVSVELIAHAPHIERDIVALDEIVVTRAGEDPQDSPRPLFTHITTPGNVLVHINVPWVLTEGFSRDFPPRCNTNLPADFVDIVNVPSVAVNVSCWKGGVVFALIGEPSSGPLLAGDPFVSAIGTSSSSTVSTLVMLFHE